MAWFTSPSGITCVAAYDAVGASSLADSYTNEANPGTYTAAPGVAPTWAAGTGWTFDGLTQYLTTGVVPASGWSLIVRFSSAAANTAYLGLGTDGASATFGISPNRANGSVILRNGGVLTVNGQAAASGVMCVAGANGYKDGVSIASTIPAWSGTGKAQPIGAIFDGSAYTTLYTGNIQALAIYSGTLTAADVATITAAMNALPAGKGLPVIAYHWAEQFGVAVG